MIIIKVNEDKNVQCSTSEVGLHTRALYPRAGPVYRGSRRLHRVAALSAVSRSASHGVLTEYWGGGGPGDCADWPHSVP